MFDKNRLRLKHYNNFAWVYFLLPLIIDKIATSLTQVITINFLKNIKLKIYKHISNSKKICRINKDNHLFEAFHSGTVLFF